MKLITTRREIPIDRDRQFTRKQYDGATGTVNTFMSNFHQLLVPIEAFGLQFWNSEGYYMAQRTQDDNIKVQIAEMSLRGGKYVKQANKLFSLDNDEENRASYMLIAVRAKFQYNKDLLEKILTVEGDIIEKNWWGDTLFGVLDKTLKGANILGEVLEEVRWEYK